MLLSDVEYMSEGYIEVFKFTGCEAYYVPLDKVNTSRNKFGEFKFNYLDENKVYLNVLFTRDAQVDKDVAEFWTGRVNATCTFVKSQLKNSSIVVQKMDAIDVSLKDGTTQRYIITGFKQDPVLGEIFTKVSVTDIEHAFDKTS